jgi:hypothetical protein
MQGEITASFGDSRAAKKKAAQRRRPDRLPGLAIATDL